MTHGWRTVLGDGPPPERAARAALLVLGPACALGTFASEVSVAFAALVACWLGWRAWRSSRAGAAERGAGGSEGAGDRGPASLGPIGGGATWSYALVWLLLVPISGNLHEGLGHVWPIAPLFILPMLIVAARLPPGRHLGVHAGLLCAAGVGAYAAVEGLFREAHGPFSHHLTLAYALLPPLGVALQKRSPLALPIALGVLGSRSSGALIALLVTVGLGLSAGADAARGRESAPARSGGAALVGMALTALALPLGNRAELHQRAILWTGGLIEGLGSGIDVPAGPGGYPAATAPLYERLQPGFWFPNHAHDSGTQLLAVLGPAGWVCGVLLVVALFDAFGAGAAAGLAGVCIGSLTQDTFGDLEVVRAVVIWGGLGGLQSARRGGGCSRATGDTVLTHLTLKIWSMRRIHATFYA